MAVVFNGDVEDVPEKLSYDIRIYQPYIDWKIDKRFVKTHAYVPDQGQFCIFFGVVLLSTCFCFCV